MKNRHNTSRKLNGLKHDRFYDGDYSIYNRKGAKSFHYMSGELLYQNHSQYKCTISPSGKVKGKPIPID